MRAIQRELTPGTMVIGIVKADGYGHGAVAVAQTIDRFVSGYGVATADEALQLRKHGIRKGILVLGPVARERYEELVREEIRPTIFRYENAKELSKTACRLERTAKLHIAVDTGMGASDWSPESRRQRRWSGLLPFPESRSRELLPILPERMSGKRNLPGSSLNGFPAFWRFLRRGEFPFPSGTVPTALAFWSFVRRTLMRFAPELFFMD